MTGWPGPFPLVEMDWLDSHALGGWRDADAWTKRLADLDTRCRSVGYLFADDAERIVLVQSLSAAGECSDALVVPRAAVLSVRMVARRRSA